MGVYKLTEGWNRPLFFVITIDSEVIVLRNGGNVDILGYCRAETGEEEREEQFRYGRVFD